MEKLYRKNSKGRYEEFSIGYNHDLADGIWLVQNKPHSKSFESLLWKVGDLKRPVDVVTHTALYSFESTLTKYLMKLTEEGSTELKEAEDLLGGYLKGAVGFYNISAADLCHLLLRQIALNVEESEK
jgi:hypothetical protein